MIRIIHLSDFHVGFEDMEDRFIQIIRGLIFEKGEKANDYVLIITGDLVENANVNGCYERVLQGIKKLRKAGFKDILVIPGNHDYGTGDNGNKKFVAKFKKVFFGKSVTYPKLDIIQDVAFIGMDSMAGELHWHDKLFAEGELGKKQLARLEKMLIQKNVQACKKRVVYLHHHPFAYRPFHYLKDSKSLKSVLQKAIKKGISIDAILYGHNHEGKAHNGQWGIARCYDGGSSTLKPRPPWLAKLPWFQVRSSIRVIDLDNDPRLDYILHLL